METNDLSNRYSCEIKERIVNEYFASSKSVRQLAKENKINFWTLRDWVRKASDSNPELLNLKPKKTSNEIEDKHIEVLDEGQLIEITNEINNISNVSSIEKKGDCIISLSLNGFEIKASKESLKEILEAIKNVRD